MIFMATQSRKNLLQGVRRDDSIRFVGGVKLIYIMLTRASFHLDIVGDTCMETLSTCICLYKSIVNFIAA